MLVSSTRCVSTGNGQIQDCASALNAMESDDTYNKSEAHWKRQWMRVATFTRIHAVTALSKLYDFLLFLQFLFILFASSQMTYIYDSAFFHCFHSFATFVRFSTASFHSTPAHLDLTVALSGKLSWMHRSVAVFTGIENDWKEEFKSIHIHRAAATATATIITDYMKCEIKCQIYMQSMGVRALAYTTSATFHWML